MTLVDVFIPLEENTAQKLRNVHLVMKRMQHTLWDFIVDDDLPLYVENISYIIYQVLFGVGHLHKSGIIHRVGICIFNTDSF
jgi:serine/threonine protein kinase